MCNQEMSQMFFTGIKLTGNGILQIVNFNRFKNVYEACGVYRQ